jgi:hypothetical protein
MVLITEAREQRKAIQDRKGLLSLDSVSGEAWDCPGVFCPCNPSVRSHLKRWDSVGESILVAAQICSTDWPVHQQLVNFGFGCDSEYSNALGHAREQVVCFFNGPNIGPAVLLNEQGTKRVRGLFAKDAVWSN